jgi:hypothetical protein
MVSGKYVICFPQERCNFPHDNVGKLFLFIIPKILSPGWRDERGVYRHTLIQYVQYLDDFKMVK